MSHDANSLQLLYKFPTTTVLQEYFVSIYEVENFLKIFWRIINHYKVNLLNLSLRYIKELKIKPFLNYAGDSDCASIVLYINTQNTDREIKFTRYKITYRK